VVGFLSTLQNSPIAPFQNGLKELGYVEGQNVEIDWGWASGRERLRSQAEDLVRRQVAVIVATSGAGPILAAKAATSTIPIVFAYSGGDPVELGLVNSLNRPGGNITGVIYLSSNLGAKRLNLLRDLVPQATTVAFLRVAREARDLTIAREARGGEQDRDILAAAQALGRQLIVLGRVDGFSQAIG
jgi:putative ABC transport system substrate-binding protein